MIKDPFKSNRNDVFDNKFYFVFMLLFTLFRFLIAIFLQFFYRKLGKIIDFVAPPLK